MAKRNVSSARRPLSNLSALAGHGFRNRFKEQLSFKFYRTIKFKFHTNGGGGGDDVKIESGGGTKT